MGLGLCIWHLACGMANNYVDGTSATISPRCLKGVDPEDAILVVAF